MARFARGAPPSPAGGEGYLLPEQPEVDGFAHLEIADGRGMNAVTAIIRDLEEIGIVLAAHDLVEVEHGIEARTFPDPGVHVVADLGLLVVPASIGDAGYERMARHDGSPDDVDASRLGAADDSLDPSLHLLGGGAAAVVVVAEEEDLLAGSGMGEDVSVEVFNARRRIDGPAR